MDRESLLLKLRQSLAEEIKELTGPLNQDLLTLERSPPPEQEAALRERLLRSLHTLKGASRSAAVPEIERACHLTEEVLARAPAGALPSGGRDGLLDLLFATVDALEVAGDALRAGAPVPPAMEEVCRKLERTLEGGLRDADAPGPQPPPTRREDTEVSPPPGPGARAQPGSTGGAPASLRIASSKVDALLGPVGDLLLARDRLQDRRVRLMALRDDVRRWRAEWADAGTMARRLGDQPAARLLLSGREHIRSVERRLESLVMELEQDHQRVASAVRPLDAGLRRLRMVPFAQIAPSLERTVRDVARASGKKAALALTGGDTVLDGAILDKLRAPLLHLVRNAVAHGIEPVDERARRGKDPTGQVGLLVSLRGSQVDVEVSDDGRGVDLEQVGHHARRLGLPPPGSAEEAVRLLFRVGFTTAPGQSDIAGRGVGLDIVAREIEAIHGRLELTFTPGAGTRIWLGLPLTLGSMRALLVVAGGETWALPETNVVRLARLPVNEAKEVGGRPARMVDGRLLPVLSLARLLGRTPVPSPTAPTPPAATLAVVLSAGERRVLVEIEDVVGEQEILAKGLGARLRRLRLCAAITTLPDGRSVPVLNVAEVLARGAEATSARVADTRLPVPRRRRILLVEDSVTTRALEQSILETAGYEVQSAADGEAAWRMLQGGDGPPHVVVADVQMPRMDGIALTRAIRGSRALRRLPVVLVTALADEADRLRGLEAGADAYLVKSAFDQKELLDVLERLIPVEERT